jgi:hypothetical protein
MPNLCTRLHTCFLLRANWQVRVAFWMAWKRERAFQPRAAACMRRAARVSQSRTSNLRRAMTPRWCAWMHTAALRAFRKALWHFAMRYRVWQLMTDLHGKHTACLVC